ncbi:MAG: porphobilinogen synthase [Candidatus Margulisiibacteriota bacterium]
MNINPHSRKLHRYRQTPAHRALVAETHLNPAQFVMPIFVHEDLVDPQPIASLPGISQWPLSHLNNEVESILKTGIRSVILFGIPNHKDPAATEAYNTNGIVQRAIRQLKTAFPDLIVMADCCLCEYTSHGHCGLLKPGQEPHFDLTQTLETLGKTALSYAEAGADIIAPSGMMDGMIAHLRTTLDAAQFDSVALMSYAVKFASNFYGPFRDAAGSAGNFIGDRKHHQLAYTQRREALLEAADDEAEGADFLMVKPAMAYLDIIRDLRNTTHLPLAAYHVSGEYSMIKAAAEKGILDEHAAFDECFTALRRAGTDIIISYAAKAFWTR